MDIIISKDYLGNYVATYNLSCQSLNFIGIAGVGETEQKALKSLYEQIKEIKLYTLAEIKKEYSSISNLLYLDLDEYIQHNFIPVYDDDLNFIGYEKNDIGALLNDLSKTTSKNH